MNIWVIEAMTNKEYQPISMEYSRDQARVTQQRIKAQQEALWGNTVKSRIRKYTQDPYSRG